MKILRTKIKKEFNLRTEKNFPIEGMEFIDINPLLFDKEVYKEITNKFARNAKKCNADYIVCPEARGFLLGTAVAYKLGIGILPVRKRGKLAPSTIVKEVIYEKEYGVDYLSLPKLDKDSYVGKNFYIIDDVYATGNTIKAISDGIKELGGSVTGVGVIINIKELNKSKGVYSLIDVNEEY